MNKPASAADLQQVIMSISDQLCATVDNDYDIHISVDTDDIHGQKLSLLINFLLENVRRHNQELVQLNEELEARVKERTEQLDMVISGSSDGVWIWDAAKDSVSFSGNWFQMAGEQPLDEPQNPEYWLSRVHPKDRVRLKAAIRAVMEGSKANLHAEYRIRHQTGGYRWMLARGVCQRNELGFPKLLAGTQTDITYLRSVDPQTGLPNEHYLKERIEDLLEADSPFYTIVFTVRQLSSLSESLDQQSTEALHQEISQRLMDQSHFTRLLARLPGNSYALLGQVAAGDNPHEQLQLECSRIQQVFNKPYHIRGDSTQLLSASIGALVSTDWENLSVDDVSKGTWLAEKTARQTDKVCIYNQALHQSHQRRLKLEKELHRGLETGMVKPYFQPIVSSTGQRLVGFEALARFEHPQMGMISPGEFVPVAEQSGMMCDLGSVILRESMAGLKRLKADQPAAAELYISVNVSVLQLMSEQFARRLVEMTDEIGFDRRYLRLEVTESLFVENMEHAVQQLAQLRAAGIAIALDDFGTGYSSLSYLRRLPIDVLKIDRSFVTRSHEDESNVAILRTVYDLARELSLEVIAEGIESREELDVLNSLGPMSLQGYYFSKPLPEKMLGDFLSAWVKGNSRDSSSLPENPRSSHTRPSS